MSQLYYFLRCPQGITADAAHACAFSDKILFIWNTMQLRMGIHVILGNDWKQTTSA